MTHPEGPFCQARFDHRQHVKFAWSTVRERGAVEAETIVSDEIRDFAARHAPGKYHQTMTSFWVRLVAHTLEVADSGDFERHVAQLPVLLDKRAAWRHYSDMALVGTGARARFVAPDLTPIP
jgi:hypothetical protein